MNLLDQSRNDAQLWIFLLVKVKSNAVKNYNRNMEYYLHESRETRCDQAGNSKSEH